VAWHYSRKVLASFCGYEDTNSWVYLDGNVGWKKLREDQEDAHINMTTLLTHAKADDRYVDVDEDPVGFIRYVYVW
jgi:hypothetical protein